MTVIEDMQQENGVCDSLMALGLKKPANYRKTSLPEGED
jgi:hypothetical protein